MPPARAAAILGSLEPEGSAVVAARIATAQAMQLARAPGLLNARVGGRGPPGVRAPRAPRGGGRVLGRGRRGGAPGGPPPRGRGGGGGPPRRAASPTC